MKVWNSSLHSEKLAHACARWASTSWAFMLALLLTITWLVCGPIMQFSNTWQLMMNTLSSVTTFVMVFLLSRSQSKSTLAMQLKLDEIIASLHGANNRLINIEDLEEKEIMELHKRYQGLANHIQDGESISTHSLETGHLTSTLPDNK